MLLTSSRDGNEQMAKRVVVRRTPGPRTEQGNAAVSAMTTVVVYIVTKAGLCSETPWMKIRLLFLPDQAGVCLGRRSQWTG